jgi:hypothetical protein
VSPAAQHAGEKKAAKAEPKGKAHGAKGGGAKKTTSAPKKIGGS